MVSVIDTIAGARRPALGAVSPSREEFRALAARAPGHPGDPAAARRRRDARSGSTASCRRPARARSCSSRRRTARSWSRWSFVGVRSAGRAHRASTARRIWTGDAAGRPAGTAATRWPRCATTRRGAAHRPAARPAAADRRHGRLPRLRRRPPAGAAARARRRRPALPELVMLLATDLAALDHHEGTVTLIANAINWDDSDERVDEAYDDAVAPAGRDDRRAGRARPADGRRLPTGRAAVHRAGAARPSTTRPSRPPRRRSAPARRSRSCVSQRFEMPTARPTRWTSTGCCGPPTPARTCTCCGWIATASASTSSAPARRRWSPCATGMATTHPIAGTRLARRRPRRRTRCWRRTCCADEKERAEHVMLVDLGRNDLGRVCEPGTVKVRRLLLGRALQPRHAPRLHGHRPAAPRARTAFDAVAACFPAGTLSGAPKPRAMEIIEELEPTRRGLYGGDRRLPRLRRRRRHRDRHPHRADARRRRLRAGRRRDRRRLRPGRRGRRVPEQGARGARRGRDRRDAARRGRRRGPAPPRPDAARRRAPSGDRRALAAARGRLRGRRRCCGRRRAVGWSASAARRPRSAAVSAGAGRRRARADRRRAGWRSPVVAALVATSGAPRRVVGACSCWSAAGRAAAACRGAAASRGRAAVGPPVAAAVGGGCCWSLAGVRAWSAREPRLPHARAPRYQPADARRAGRGGPGPGRLWDGAVDDGEDPTVGATRPRRPRDPATSRSRRRGGLASPRAGRGSAGDRAARGDGIGIGETAATERSTASETAVSVLEAIVEGVRADLAAREAAVAFDEIKARGRRRAAAARRAGRAARRRASG